MGIWEFGGKKWHHDRSSLVKYIQRETHGWQNDKHFSTWILNPTSLYVIQRDIKQNEKQTLQITKAFFHPV